MTMVTATPPASIANAGTSDNRNVLLSVRDVQKVYGSREAITRAIEAKKSDRRVIRTRSAIRKAFTDLLAETAYNKITITALAKRADVDRKTFYTHYSSVDNLLEDVIRIQTEKSLEGIDFRDFFADPPTCTKRLLCRKVRLRFRP